MFRTTVNDCLKLILPVCNELFQSGYTGNEIIVKTENEIFLHKQYGELEGDTLTVRFPESAILYLRSDKKTPKSLWMKMETPGGIVRYPIPVMKIKDYSLDMIFEKELYFIIPFYIFTYEKDLKKYEKNPSMRMQLKQEFLDMQNRLQKCTEEGLIDEYTRCTLLDMSKKVVRSLLGNKYPQTEKGVEEVMGGNILEYEAKTILNKGKAEGHAEGHAKGIKEGIKEGRMEGVLSTLSELVQKGLLDIRDAAEQASMTVEEFEIRAKELIGALR